MKPAQRQSNHQRFANRKFALVCCAVGWLALAGCTGSLLNSRSQSPEHEGRDTADADTKLVGDFAAPYGTTYIRVEGPVLITSLAGTGSDPALGPQRAALLADMEAHTVVNPNHVLSSPNNSLAWAVRIYHPVCAKAIRWILKSASRRQPKPPVCAAAG